MELTKKQLEYVRTCLNFHYSESDHKEFYLEINSSICRLIEHEIKQFDELQNKIDRNREKQPKPEWD
jgi:hypothetical protein|tara:strand:+ start:183 stop:383 length:201 start_codon:yes stop_codon:yes gene_type:complete